MASGMPLVEISPEETLEQATEIAGYAAFREEQQQARAKGRLVGVGISLYIEPQTPMTVYGAEPCHIRVQPNGTVDVYIGSGSHGQGLETTTAQLVAEHLGVDYDDVAVHQGDTAETPYAFGTGGSRSGPVLGAAIRQSALQLREKVAELAAHRLEAAVDDIEIVDSVASVRGTPAQAITLGQLARSAYFDLADLPPGMEPGLEVISRYRAPDLMYSNACHLCMVEIDRVTGGVKILRYVVSEDCGVMINPAVVHGQIDGGTVQGIGGALLEEFVYDEAGNPLTTTFLDYLLPTAGDVPIIEHGHIETPAVANAVNDALAQVGAAVFAHPLSPPRIRAALEDAGA
jgi:carbon-monoxide dehydrogenase large subunit